MKSSRHRVTVQAALAAAMVTTAGANADTLRVPSDYPTIQAAIDAAAISNDEIVVADGVYYESIDLLGKAVHLRSENGAARAAIDSTLLGASAVHMTRREDLTTVIEGFTLTGRDRRSGACSEGFGGAMRLLGASPSVLNCRFVDSSAECGGAVYIDSGFGVFVGCEFVDNVASNSGGGGFGGAVFITGRSEPTFLDCEFESNAARAGAAIRSYMSEPRLISCTFVQNRADLAGWGLGGALDLVGGAYAPLIHECAFLGNIASGAGGAVRVGGDAGAQISRSIFIGNHASEGGALRAYSRLVTASIDRCEFSGNTADTRGGAIASTDGPIALTHSRFVRNTANDGGAMYLEDGAVAITGCELAANLAVSFGGAVLIHQDYFVSSATIVNSTIANNAAGIAGGGVYSGPANPHEIDGSILWANAPDQINSPSHFTVAYSIVEGGLPAGTGVIDEDPRFVDPEKFDYRLSPNSPAIDAADNSSLPRKVELDLVGAPRWRDDPGKPDSGRGTAPMLDCGACEFQGVSFGVVKPSPGRAGARNAFRVVGAPPHGVVVLAAGLMDGVSNAPGCPGVTIDIDDPRFHAVQANGQGEVTLTEYVPALLQGVEVFMQPYLPDSCRVGERLAYRFE
ncbi:MAG: right-handed parallel beta-helix repeat-containing protein [Phycisphaerales bacterium]